MNPGANDARSAHAGVWRPWVLATEALAAVMAASFIAFLAAAPISCTDFFWHLELGQIILRERRIPDTDLFSAVHPDAPYVQPQWLWESLSALVYEAGGLLAIRVAQAIALVASYIVLHLIVRRWLKHSSLTWFVTGLALLLFFDRFRARPDSLTLGFFALSLPLLLDPRWGAIKPRAAYAFVLALVWANMHGGASLLLLLSMGALLVGSWFEHDGGDSTPVESGLRPAALSFAATCAGLLLSPTLIRGLIHWFTLIGPQIDTGNEEWLPTYASLKGAPSLTSALIVASSCAVFVGYVLEQSWLLMKRGRSQVRVGEWLLCGGYLLLSQHAIRNVFLCLLPLLFMFRRRTRVELPRSASWSAALAAIVLFSLVFDGVVMRAFGGIARARELTRLDLMPGTYPEDAADFLADAHLHGGIFNEGKWGGYLVFRTWPDCHVFVDTRQNLTPEMWNVFLATLSAKQRTQALEFALRKWGVELAVFRGPTFPLIAAPEHYQLLYKAGDQEVYQHRAGPNSAGNLQRARNYLVSQGARIEEDLTVAATRIGSQHWLARPEQRRVAEHAQQLTRSSDPSTQGEGYVTLADLWYRAGLYARATEAFSEARTRGERAPRSLYFAALSSFALGDHERARMLSAQLRGSSIDALSGRQRERLAMLNATLQR